MAHPGRRAAALDPDAAEFAQLSEELQYRRPHRLRKPEGCARRAHQAFSRRTTRERLDPAAGGAVHDANRGDRSGHSQPRGSSVMATAAAEPPIDIGKPEPQLAAAIAPLTWFGLFMAFGGAFVQMWQLVTLVERPLLQD